MSMEVLSSSASSSARPKRSDAGDHRSRKRRNVCIGVTLVVIGIIVLVLILALTVFKAKSPITTLNSVSLQDLDASFDMARLGLDLNVSLGINLSIKNPNKVGFKYKNSTALLNYRGELVGEAPIPSGKIASGQTLPMNITLVIMADRLLYKSKLYSDVLSGTLSLNTYTRISGKVTILGLFKVHVVSSTSCDFNINVSNRSIADQHCQYHTKL